MTRLSKWNATRLYQEHSAAELVEIAEGLKNDPANENPDSRINGGKSIYLFTKETHRRLDAIAQAITWHLNDARQRPGCGARGPCPDWDCPKCAA